MAVSIRRISFAFLLAASAAAQERAARAYDQYQKCGLKAARRLFYAQGQ